MTFSGSVKWKIRVARLHTEWSIHSFFPTPNASSRGALNLATIWIPNSNAVSVKPILGASNFARLLAGPGCHTAPDSAARAFQNPSCARRARKT